MKKIALIISTALVFSSCMKTIDVYTITAESNDTTMGTVTGGGSYVEGSTATLEAIPNPGCRFERWNDGYNNTENPRRINVHKDASYMAVFKNNTSVKVKDDFYSQTYDYENYSCYFDVSSKKMIFSTSLFSTRPYPMIELQYKWDGEICNGTFVGHSNIDFSAPNITLGNPYLWFYNYNYSDNPVYIGNQSVGDIWCEDVTLKIVSINLDTKLVSFTVDANCLDYYPSGFSDAHNQHHLTITATDIPITVQ